MLRTSLGRYVDTVAFRAILLVAFGLTALFSLLGFVEQLAFVGQGNYHLVDALGYVALTVPARMLQVAPVSVLLGAQLALGGLARHSELVAMSSLGVPKARVVFSMLGLSAPIVIMLFLLAQFVVPTMQQHAQSLRTAALFTPDPRDDPEAFRQGDFWAQDAGQYLNVRRFGYDGSPGQIEIMAFADGQLQSFIHADGAALQPGGIWLLRNAVRKRVTASGFETDQLAALPWHSFLSAKQLELLRLSPRDMPPVALFRYVGDLKRHHLPALRFEQELWMQASIPLSVFAMIMIATSFAFALPRGQSTGQHVMVGGVLGIVFTLVQQIANRLELLLGLSPAATAVTPPLLLMALAVYLISRSPR